MRNTKIWEIYGEEAEKYIPLIKKWLNRKGLSHIKEKEGIVDIIALMISLVVNYGGGDAYAGLILKSNEVKSERLPICFPK